MAVVIGICGTIYVGHRSALGDKVPADAPEIKVMVAVPEGSAWVLRDEKSAVAVVLEDISGKPLSLYQSWNSWGYDNVRLEWETAGKKGTVTASDRAWTKNFPSTTTVPAGGAMVREIDMGDSWVGWPELKEGMKLTLRAVYESKQEGGGWRGKAESEPVTVEVRDFRKP
jgi:hypothetical protein